MRAPQLTAATFDSHVALWLYRWLMWYDVLQCRVRKCCASWCRCLAVRTWDAGLVFLVTQKCNLVQIVKVGRVSHDRLIGYILEGGFICLVA